MALDDFGKGGGPEKWSRNIHVLIDEMHKRRFVQFRGTGCWQPALNVYESPSEFAICVDLAGMAEDQVRVTCESERRLTITGQRDKPLPPDDPHTLSIHVMEIDEGEFRRELELPRPVDMAAVEARYDKGYLWVHLPKKTTAR